jgi:hypothetical protein
MAALMLSLERVGWRSIGPTRWRSRDGTLWEFQEGVFDLEELMSTLEQDAEAWLWKNASKHYLGEGLQRGANMRSAWAMVKYLKSKGAFKSAGILEDIMARNYWTKSRRVECNLEDNLQRPRCGDDIESPTHRFWLCPANFNGKCEKQDHDMENAQVRPRNAGLDDPELDGPIQEEEHFGDDDWGAQRFEEHMHFEEEEPNRKEEQNKGEERAKEKRDVIAESQQLVGEAVSDLSKRQNEALWLRGVMPDDVTPPLPNDAAIMGGHDRAHQR